MMLRRESARTVQRVGHKTQIPIVLLSKLESLLALNFLKTVSCLGENLISLVISCVVSIACLKSFDFSQYHYKQDSTNGHNNELILHVVLHQKSLGNSSSGATHCTTAIIALATEILH